MALWECMGSLMCKEKEKRAQTPDEPPCPLSWCALWSLKGGRTEYLQLFSNRNFAWLPRPAGAWGCSAGGWAGTQKALAWNSGKCVPKSKITEPAGSQSGTTSSFSEGLVSLSHWPLCLSKRRSCAHDVCCWGQAVGTCHCSSSCQALVH